MNTNHSPYRARLELRPKTIVSVLGTALMQMAAGAAWADSGVGVDTQLGNALNPATFSSARERDPEGMGEGQNERTPTGFLYGAPFIDPEPTRTPSGWEYSGSIEAGVIGGSGNERAAGFRAYKDVDNGLYLNNFRVQAEKPDAARFLEVFGGGTTFDDQFYGLRFGRYNDWRVRAFYNESPHVFTSTYRNLWNGTGTSSLTLNGLAPGGTTSAAVTNTNLRAAALATPYSELGIVRKKGGVRFDMNLPSDWKLFASYANEKREGARPFGMVMGGGGGTGGLELPESVDSDTHDMVAGVQWSDRLSSFNGQISASFFRNNIDTLSFENPMFLPAANGVPAGAGTGAFPRGRFDLHPDNDYLNLKGEYARAFPQFYDARFTALVSASRLRQNDDLLASTTYPGVIVNGVAGGAWDTTASLSRQSADAKIDTQLVDLGLSLKPVKDLDLKGKVRRYDTGNSTQYWACNPLNGQWGRLLNDGSGASMVATPAYLAAGCSLAAAQALGVVPNAGNIPIRNMPFEYTQTNYALSGDYRLSRHNSVNASLEREEYDRKHRERAETWENRLKLGYVNRSLERGTLRLSYEHDRRRGSEYVSDPYHAFFSSALGPLPTAAATNLNSWIHALAQARKFDLADRDQNILNARMNYALRPDLDGGLSLQWKDARYPDSAYGRTDHQKQNSVNLDLNWQASTTLSMYGFYSYQNGRISQANIQTGVACTIPAGGFATTAQTEALLDSCANAGSTLLPLDRRWAFVHKDRSDVLGFGLFRDFGKARLDLSFTHVSGSTTMDQQYGAGIVIPPATQGLVDGGFSRLRFTQNILEAGLVMPIRKQLSIRMLLRHEQGKIRDWHYDGVAANPVPGTNQQVYLDAGPIDYRATLLGAFVKFDF